MGLNKTNVIDAIGHETFSKTLVLTILDSWDWSNEKVHMDALKEKIDEYFVFIESGEIFKSCPEASGSKVRIDVISKFDLPKAGSEFLKGVNEIASELNTSIHNKRV